MDGSHRSAKYGRLTWIPSPASHRDVNERIPKSVGLSRTHTPHLDVLEINELKRTMRKQEATLAKSLVQEVT